MNGSEHGPLRLTAEAKIELHAAADGKPAKRPTFEILAYTGGLMNVVGFYRPVAVDIAGLRAGERVAVLLEHDPAKIIGQGKVTRSADSVRVAGVVTADDEHGQKVVSHARNGFTWQASIGVNPTKIESVEAGAVASVNGKTVSGPATIVRAGRLGKVSFVAIGADDGTVAQVKGNRSMPQTNTIETNTTVPPAGDHQKLAEIAGRHPAILARAVAENWTAERTELEVLRTERDKGRLEAALNQYEPVPVHATAAAPVDNTAAAQAAFLMFAGHADVAKRQYDEQTVRAAERLRISSTSDVDALALHMAGRDVPADRMSRLRAAFTTYSLPNILGPSAEKLALDMFQSAPEPWRTIGRRMPLANFKDTKLVRFVASSRFNKVGPGGELQHGPLSETSGSIRLETHGRIFSITREDWVNDDLAVLSELAAEIGREGARTIGDTAHELIQSNPSNFFHADNANYLEGAGTALGVDSVGQAVAQMRKQTDPHGRRIGMVPRYLVCGPDLEATARQVLNSMEVAAAAGSPTGNPARGVLELVVDARLDAPEWYVYADPRESALVIGLLNGRDTVTVEFPDPPADKLGSVIRGFIDFGVALREPSVTRVERVPFTWTRGQIREVA